MNKLKLIGRYGSNRDGRLDSAVGFTHSRLINGHSPGRPAGHSQGRFRGLASKGPTPHRERVIPPFCHCHNGRANKRAPEGLSVTRPPRIRSMNAARSDGNACKARLNASKTHWHTGLSAERMMISRALSLSATYSDADMACDVTESLDSAFPDDSCFERTCVRERSKHYIHGVGFGRCRIHFRSGAEINIASNAPKACKQGQVKIQFSSISISPEQPYRRTPDL